MPSNLFHIDLEVVRSTLEDANTAILRERDRVLRRVDEVSPDATLHDRNDLIKELRRIEKDLKRAQTADGRGFRTATSAIKRFFDQARQPVSEAIQRLLPTSSELATTKSSVSVPVVISSSGELVGERHLSSVTLDGIQENLEVIGFNRSELISEEIFPFLTDYQILCALRKHSAKNRNIRLNGVEYRETVSAK